MKSRQREAESSSRHSVDVVTVEIEKLRSELRFAHEKIATSQKLDLNLERGRLRDDLQRQDDKTGAMESRLDREISSMKTTIEAAKNDVIKYSIGAIMSICGGGDESHETCRRRALMYSSAKHFVKSRRKIVSQAAGRVLATSDPLFSAPPPSGVLASRWAPTFPWPTRASAWTCARRSSPRWRAGTC